jgi:glycosyltransferase involved in cell wall biosynthesis
LFFVNKPVLSVAVCTYNRADLLSGCLQSLAEQTADKSQYEVIVVNNNSTDATQEICEEFAKKHSNFRLVREPRQGLAYARNKGWNEAWCDYVGFIDDDAKADKEWLKRAHETIKTIRPEIFGGPYYPFYIGEKPKWMSDKFGTMQYGESGFLEDNQFLSGSNIFFKKTLLDELGGFNPDLGMKGSKIDFGEETWLIVKARKAGIKTYYCHDMKVYHLVAEYKKNPFWYLQAAYEHGRSADRMFMTDHQYEEGELIYGLLKDLDLFVSEMRRCILDAQEGEMDFLENRVIERLAPVMDRLGAASARYGGLFDRSGGTEDILRHVREKEILCEKRIADIEGSYTFRVGKLVTFPVQALLSFWNRLRSKSS